MPKKLLFFFFIHASIYAQTNRTIFFGKISDELGLLENVHIININTNQATHTNTFGKFKIFAKANDSLKITSVGYKTKTLILKTSDFSITEKQIHLKKEIIELDEVEIKKHNLIGSIESDIKQTPIDKIAEMSEKIVNDIKSMDYNAIMRMPIGKDELHLQKVAAPSIPNSFQGAGTSASLPNYDGIKKRANRRLIKFKEELPSKLLSEFGQHFFFTELKIPKEKYHHFLEYCNPVGLEELYRNNKIIDVIKLLQRESKSYLKIINENK